MIVVKENEMTPKDSALEWLRNSPYSYTARNAVVEVPYEAIAALCDEVERLRDDNKRLRTRNSELGDF